MGKSLIEEYLDLFEDLPPLIMSLSFEHEVYQNLLRVAIDTKTEITLDMIEKEIERLNVKYDLFEGEDI